MYASSIAVVNRDMGFEEGFYGDPVYDLIGFPWKQPMK
jgi:hypothetical protein